MNLLFAIDNRVTEQLLTTLYSIKQNTRDHNFSVYVIQDKELADTKKKAS